MDGNGSADSDPSYESIVPTVSGNSIDNLTGNKSLVAKGWSNIDNTFLKPLLTHTQPSLMDTMPRFNQSILRAFTSTEQLRQRQRYCHSKP